MNYYGPQELAASFRTVRKNTILIAEDIGEEHYEFRAAPELRTVAQTLFHIAWTPSLPLQIHGVEKRTTMEGFDFMSFFGKLIADEQTPRTKERIIAELTSEGARFAAFLDGTTDEFLAESISFPVGMTPGSKTRFEMLLGVKEHEMHHRAQLMMVERMLGIVPHMTREMQARIAAMQAASKASA